MPHPMLDAANVPPALAQWGQRVGSLTEVPALLRALGAEPAAVLASAGLTAAMLAHPENRIEYPKFGLLMRNAAEAVYDAPFGLLLGSMWHLESMGVIGEVMRNSATVGEALHMLVVHQHINSAGGLTFLLRRATVVDFGYAVYYPGAQGVDQIFDATLITGVNYMRELVGPGWHPTEVFLPRPKPADTLPYRRLFGVAPRFNSEVCSLRFPAHWLDRRIEGADAARKAQALARAREVHPSVVMQAYRGLRTLLLHGKCSGDDLAQLLSMHRRTLNRRLHAEGTTFQAVLDDVRFEVARQLLVHTNMGLDDIAASLGYAAVSPFMRTFRRWCGMTPGQWRRRALHGDATATVAAPDAPLPPTAPLRGPATPSPLPVGAKAAMRSSRRSRADVEMPCS